MWVPVAMAGGQGIPGAEEGAVAVPDPQRLRVIAPHHGPVAEGAPGSRGALGR